MSMGRNKGIKRVVDAQSAWEPRHPEAWHLQILAFGRVQKERQGETLFHLLCIQIDHKTQVFLRKQTQSHLIDKDGSGLVQ